MIRGDQKGSSDRAHFAQGGLLLDFHIRGISHAFKMRLLFGEVLSILLLLMEIVQLTFFLTSG